MILAAAFFLATMSSSDAIVCLLNTTNACGARTYAEARAVVLRDAAGGKTLQQFVAGVTLHDEARAQEYLSASRGKIRFLAEKKNNPLAWYLLSLERNDFACLQKAADGGNVQALNAMGAIAVAEAFDRKNLETNKLERILNRSYNCFRRAAEQRDANGFINLGTCYQRGFGCPVDLVRAFRCFLAAAQLGHPEGMDYVSACYQFGHGVPRSDEQSLSWGMRARALRGDRAAMRWLRDRRAANEPYGVVSQ